MEMLSAISLTPNPATDILNFELDNRFNLANAAVIITNMQGQQVLKAALTQHGGQLNIANLPTGLYMVEFRNAEASKVVKFTKQ
jgi:hypothetical protein